MSSYQFPPSSPLRSIDDYDSHLAKNPHEELRGRAAYPTPNPSSSLFRSSSPVGELAEGDVEAVPAGVPGKKVTFALTSPFAKVNINSDFNVLNPDASVLRVPLVGTQSKITVGRSSKSCDFYFGSSDKNVSRQHVSVCYDSEQLVLTCLGRNGLAIRIPRPCYVFATNSKDNYIVTENRSGTPLDIEALQRSHKTIRIDDNHTEFTLNRLETITLPRFNNILLEINQHIMLLNPYDLEEDLTDDEMPTLISRSASPEALPVVTPVKAPIEHFPQPRTPFKNDAKKEELTKSNEITPSKPPVIKAESIPVQLEIPQPKPSKTFKIFEDQPATEERAAPIMRQSTPLNDKSNTFSNPTTPKRKAQSEEPPKQRKKKIQESQKVEINQEWVEGLENVSEINNILINHLAFSRLSSTPGSFLKTISALTSNLTLRQIRVLLHNIECIGVIYRQGKDAAGKPLEEEYYYMPENDSDSHRTGLVSSIKGSTGLRSCRRTHKQYYWKKPAPIKK
ncbi:uncharacterized protein CANTADRAFT_22743 [Suhomyces tanzawaensis NRRL Y-17324]|uniref:FHA domain-containing protein n=1 Tax=Suhomyces tanzawaensis NRRL Y-17324 TaxID=984487 RepID=A0A1E4SGZ6_9ASCO|nr:uncharacterized protein CANTADRAFT_22743 [Suhomyces tanzawaensis NRRL Y-17324]ODV78789.1 hypothetical protein CANTADRAFT_22743 [Suhomyces tanzawaensis NRRL Y-17324]